MVTSLKTRRSEHSIRRANKAIARRRALWHKAAREAKKPTEAKRTQFLWAEHIISVDEDTKCPLIEG